MIYTGNVYSIDPAVYDEVWVVGRSVGELKAMFEQHPNVLHVPDLSPSETLFRAYRELYHAGKWDKEQFDTFYTPCFLRDIQQNSNAQMLLRKLVEAGKEKRIILVCFCEDESICHRSILAKLLRNMGAEVVPV